MGTVKLPKRIIHKTPMQLKADAYTVGSNEFASDRAKKKSVYYITFRRELYKINPDLYSKDDNRIIFTGLSRILDYLFYDGTTLEEIETTERFLSRGKITTKGLAAFPFPKKIWEKIVNKYNGRPPLRISAMKEGSVVYPNEPVVMIENINDGFSDEEMGEIAAWFESTLLKVWSSSEMVTQLVHWLEYCKTIVRIVYGNEKTEDEVSFIASIMLHNFGCRAGICPQESEWLGSDSLLVFSSTDTFSGAYQAWVNSNERDGVYCSVQALAHRNVQGYTKETDCFRALKNSSSPGDINSNVADCNDYWVAVEGQKGREGKDDCLLALALESKETGDGIVTIARPDSGDPTEQVLWLCRLSLDWGLASVENHNGKEWRFGTYLKVLEGDSMKWKSMKELNSAMMAQGFPPFGWGVPYGVGGGLRNEISRDNLSAKYALCAVGPELEGVCKFSETLEKATLPGPFKILRTPEALKNKKTIAHISEEGETAMVIYFDGSHIWEPFREGYESNFNVIQERIKQQMKDMPKSLSTDSNHSVPATDLVKENRIALLKKYAPKKLAQNYK
ncbi:MAG: hypothetical protein ABIP51_00495 [Bacteroidia bacterium]